MEEGSREDESGRVVQEGGIGVRERVKGRKNGYRMEGGVEGGRTLKAGMRWRKRGERSE